MKDIWFLQSTHICSKQVQCPSGLTVDLAQGLIDMKSILMQNEKTQVNTPFYIMMGQSALPSNCYNLAHPLIDIV